MEEKERQILQSYPDRDEIRKFISPYRILPLKKVDNKELCQMNYLLPPNWLIVICLLFPLVILFILPSPLFVKIFFTGADLIMIPIFIYTFKRIFRDRIEPIKVRFLYDKIATTLNIPEYNLHIPIADIKEFLVIYGWMNTPKNKALISELSVIFKDNDVINRVPLFLSRKSECIKIAEKLSEYTGKENYFIKV